MIHVTEAAAEKITELLAEENKLESGLRVFVQGGGCSGFQYGLMIDEGEGDPESDQTFIVNGVRLCCRPDQPALPQGRGSRLSSTTTRAAVLPSRTRTPSDVRVRIVVLGLGRWPFRPQPSSSNDCGRRAAGDPASATSS
jgi:iron-sulfur cluster assembly accessory protein